MINKIFYVLCLTLIFLIQSCTLPEFRKKNPDEQVIYNKIQELRKSKRPYLAETYAIQFKEHFPHSDKNEELDLFVADHAFENERPKEANKRYIDFIKNYPASGKVPYVKQQLQNLASKDK